MKALTLNQESRCLTTFSDWIRPPHNIWAHMVVILPLAISQILQRLYHIIDNRYINHLGSDALLVHNIQYNFIILGQAIGAATATSCLIFWRRKEASGRQGSVLLRHLAFSIGVALFFASVFFPMSGQIINHFGIPAPYAALASTYLLFGLVNMVLQSIYGSLDGMLIASGQQKRSMVFAGVLVAGNWIFDAAAIYLLYHPTTAPSASAIRLPLLVVAGSTTLLMLTMTTFSFLSVKASVDGWKPFAFREIFHVWWAEAGLGIVRSITPFIYAYQLGMITATKGFLVTYQLGLHVSYIFCLPFLAGVQLAIRDASHAFSERTALPGGAPQWWGYLLYTALIPTAGLLAVGALFPVSILNLFYGYSVPNDHAAFLPIFYLACIIGQFGNVFLIPLRARKKNALVTRNMILVEFGILLGGTQLLISMGIADPPTICWVTLAYTIGHLLLNFFTLQAVVDKGESEQVMGVSCPR